MAENREIVAHVNEKGNYEVILCTLCFIASVGITITAHMKKKPLTFYIIFTILTILSSMFSIYLVKFSTWVAM